MRVGSVGREKTTGMDRWEDLLLLIEIYFSTLRDQEVDRLSRTLERDIHGNWENCYEALICILSAFATGNKFN
jgi:hypothetical protein